MKLYNHILAFLFFAVLFSACTKEQQRKLSASPTAISKSNEIVVISDSKLWMSPLKDSIEYHLGGPYLILPQPEPIFDLRHYTFEDLLEEPLRKQLRTYLILADLDDTSSPTTKMVLKDLDRLLGNKKANSITVGKNKWARGQILMYLVGHGEKELMDNFRKTYPAITYKVSNFDHNQIMNNAYVMGKNNTIKGIIQEEFGFDLSIPSPYKVAIKDEKFLWIRSDYKALNSNILIHQLPYTSKDQLTPKYLKSIINEIGKKYITTEIKGSFMKLNDVDLPFLTQVTKINGKYALEGKGIWEIENDFMGGPLVSYLVLDPEKNVLTLLVGFIHAPSKRKRDFMQHVEVVLKNAKI